MCYAYSTILLNWETLVAVRKAPKADQKALRDLASELLVLKSSPKDTFSLILEREEGRKREENISVTDKHWSIASHMSPNRGWNLQPFGVRDDVPTNWPTGPESELCFGVRRQDPYAGPMLWRTSIFLFYTFTSPQRSPWDQGNLTTPSLAFLHPTKQGSEHPRIQNSMARLPRQWC